jgi:predicted dehydrogenase
MLKVHPELQAVSVITPNKFHHPLVLEALRAGLHVFCEKPPALNSMEMAEMASCAEMQGKMLMFNLNNRARRDSLHVKKLIRDGVIGRINSAQAVWQRRTGIPGFGGWFTSKAMAGGGPLIDLVHMIDLAMWFMDYPEPEYVLAQTFHDFMDNPAFQGAWGKLVSLNGNTDVESACHGFVRFKSGQVLTFHNSWAELVREEDTFVSLQAVKTGVMIRSVNNQNTCELYSQQNGVSSDQHLRFQDDHDMGRTQMPENFVRALLGEAEPLSTPEEALTLMKLVDAAYCSAETGQPVKIV